MQIYIETLRHCVKGTTAEAQGTMAIALGVVGYFKACHYNNNNMQ